MIEYDSQLVQQVGHTLDLRAPNRAALDAFAKALEHARPGVELIADLATGVGKTYIAGGLLDYLYESGVRNVVIITPGSTIQRKTVANLTPGAPKYLRGLQSNPMVITLDNLERGEVGHALEDYDKFKVFVFTVQSLLRPDTKDARRAHRPHETLGQALSSYLANAEDLIVIADEHHVYASPTALKFRAAIAALRPAALIGLTATPLTTSEPFVVYRYPLSEAIADGYVKIPVLVSRSDKLSDSHTQMADGVTLLNVKAAAMRSYCTQTHQPYIEPVLFVVARSIEEAVELRDMLAGPDMLNGQERVLLVTSEEPETTLALLDGLEDPTSLIRAVVSVSMLKEGWDVKNIYVIAAVRSMESELLTEQILGRGLRLPFGKRTGNPMLDTVEVLSHHSFAELLKEAKVLLSQTLGERAGDTSAVVNPTPGVFVPGVLEFSDGVDSRVEPDIQVVDFIVAPHDLEQGDLFEDGQSPSTWGTGFISPAGPQVGMSFATVSSRLAGGQATWTTRTYRPRQPGGIKIPLFLPKVTTRWARDPFSLTRVSLVDVEALGQQFQNDEGASLLRKALDARREADGHVEVVITDQVDYVVAAQLPMPFDTIETDLVGRLMRTNGVAATLPELSGAVAVARAFLRGADVSESTPWRTEHGRLATTRLTEWINAQQKSSPAREVKEVTQIKWPELPDRVEARPPADRHLITKREGFQKYYPYSGWDRSVYEINAFDAYSTEFRLAVLFETSAGVAAWVRIDQTVPLRITYLVGAIQKEYEPDFLVIDSAGVNWIVEGKADDRMNDEIVLTKAAAAREWVKTVNEATNVQQRWAYMIASESAVASASSWAALKAGAQTQQ